MIDQLYLAYEPEDDEPSTPKGGAISADEDQFEAMDPSKNLLCSFRINTASLIQIGFRISDRTFVKVSARGGEPSSSRISGHTFAVLINT